MATLVETAIQSRTPPLPPRWATAFGEDRRGIFAELEVDSIRFSFRWIPPGTFRMGSPEDEEGRTEHEGPQHEVTLTRGFWMGTTPVTQAQWLAVLGQRENPSRFEGDDLPMENTSWMDSETYLEALNQRIPGLWANLPTEAQWEYGCRSGTGSAFSDGSDCTDPMGKDPALGKLGWYVENSGGKTHPVGEKQPNAWGLYDLHGNVWEWCLDGMRDYKGEAVADPVGPHESGAGRVVRGGSWGRTARVCRSAIRSGFAPVDRLDFLGFRLVAGQEPGPDEPDGRRPAE